MSPFCLMILVSCCILRPIESYNYCHGKCNLCQKGDKHFACDIESITQEKPLLARVPLTNKIKELLIDVHNKKRALIANGGEKNKAGVAFPFATRLREFEWDPELAYLAAIHAERCHMDHDKCHNTAKFKHSGQNLAYRSDNKDTVTSIDLMMNAWYDEKDLVEDPKTFVEKYVSSKGTGHFSVMINERNAHLGCSVTYCDGKPGDPYKFYHITCNYGYTNMMGVRIYQHGDSAASDCGKWGTGKSTKYPGLCENNGKVYED